eukprot:XP_793886.2 PREDICTED: mucin-5AC [Strongylocentrotus purpuratus]
MEMMEDSGRSDPLIVCPTEAELQAEPTVNVPCTVDGCSKIFNTSAARSIHVIQTHKIYKNDDERKRFTRSQQKNVTKVTKHFYCPVKMCNRSEEWKKPFSRLSLLKQHYYLVHAEKRYPCKKCDKRFSTHSQHTSHQRDCGKEFFCTCGEKHNSVTSLYMHAKRKQHDLPDEYNKRKKPEEPVKETYILVVPVPCGSPSDIHKTMCEPVPLLPHPSTCNFLPLSGTTQLINNITPTCNTIPSTVTTLGQVGTATVGVGDTIKTESRASATTSTQTDESGVNPLPPKLATSSSYAQTAHSCFPSFIPMMNGPRRHKKTLAIQTHANWSHGQVSGKMASTETQTLDGQGVAAQGHSSLGTPLAIPSRLPPLEQAIPGPFFRQFPNPVLTSLPQQDASSHVPITSRPKSTGYNYGVNTSQRSVLPNYQLDTNSTQTPWNVVAVGNNPSAAGTPSIDPRNNILTPIEVLTQTDLTFQNFLEYNTSETQTLSSVIDAMTNTNEASATQTAEASMGSPPLGPNVSTSSTSMSPARLSLGIQSNATSSSSATLGLGVQTSSTSISPEPMGIGVQTTASSMTPVPLGLDVQNSSTSVSPALLSQGMQTNATSSSPSTLGLGVQTSSSSMSPELMGIGVQTSASSMTPAPVGLGVQTIATGMSPASLDIGSQNRGMGAPPSPQGLGDQTSATSMSSAPDIVMSGLDLLFLASTEHRSNPSLDMPRMDESLCCQQTQTVFDTDTGHQEKQTAWDWSLDEFSFPDQYTQTALSSSNCTSSTTTMPRYRSVLPNRNGPLLTVCLLQHRDTNSICL